LSWKELCDSKPCPVRSIHKNSFAPGVASHMPKISVSSVHGSEPF
jgi:hypothetical protein